MGMMNGQEKSWIRNGDDEWTGKVLDKEWEMMNEQEKSWIRNRDDEWTGKVLVKEWG